MTYIPFFYVESHATAQIDPKQPYRTWNLSSKIRSWSGLHQKILVLRVVYLRPEASVLGGHKVLKLWTDEFDFPPYWPQLLVRVTFSRRCSRKHSKIIHLQKILAYLLWWARWIASEMAMIWIWDNWTISLTPFCWFVAALGLKEPSQLGEIIPLMFNFINSRFCSIYELLHCCDFFGENGTHPNVVFLQLVRLRGWVVIKNNETCNALKCLKPSGLIDWINYRFATDGYIKIAPIYQERRPGALLKLNNVAAL